MLAGTGDQLADVVFFHLDDFSDLGIFVIESLAKNICGALCGREFLKQYKHRKLQCFAALRT